MKLSYLPRFLQGITGANSVDEDQKLQNRVSDQVCTACHIFADNLDTSLFSKFKDKKVLMSLAFSLFILLNLAHSLNEYKG